ncbi:hypothetical protein [Peribacillus simplex]
MGDNQVNIKSTQASNHWCLGAMSEAIKMLETVIHIVFLYKFDAKS